MSHNRTIDADWTTNEWGKCVGGENCESVKTNGQGKLDIEFGCSWNDSRTNQYGNMTNNDDSYTMSHKTLSSCFQFGYTCRF